MPEITSYDILISLTKLIDKQWKLSYRRIFEKLELINK